MRQPAPARVNVRALIIFVVVVFLLGTGAVSGHYIRKRMIASRALADGTAALQKRDWAEACKHLRTYLERYPQNQTVLEQYAEALLENRPLEASHIAGAIGAYRKLIRENPSHKKAYERLASLYTVTQAHDDLAHIARKRLEGQPHDAQATIWLARALLSLRKPDDARQSLVDFVDQTEKSSAKHPEYALACALLASITTEPATPAARAESLSWLDRAVNYDPQSADALVHRARFVRITSKESPDRAAAISKARLDLEGADALNPTDPRTRLLLTDEWVEHGELDRAEAELTAVRGQDSNIRDFFLTPDDWIAARFLRASEIAIRRGDGPGAAKLADEALTQLPHRQQRLNVLPAAIRNYLQDGRAADARRCLDEFSSALPATGRAPEVDDSLALLEASVAMAERRPYRVIEALEPLLLRNPSHSAAWTLIAEAYERTSQFGRAGSALERAVDGARGDYAAQTRLARSHLRQGNWKKAISAARAAEAASSAMLEPRLIRIEAELNESAGSKSALAGIRGELETLQKSNPKVTQVHILLAALRFEMGAPEQAVEILKNAAETTQDGLRAQLFLARLCQNLNRHSEAVQACRAASERHGQKAAPWLALADVQLRGNDPEAAHRSLEEGMAAVTDLADARTLRMRMLGMELARADRGKAIEKLTEMAAADPRDVEIRSILLGLPDIVKDVNRAQKLIDEIRSIEGETGLIWQMHQARLWLAAGNWRERQAEITEMLTYCTNADPQSLTPALLLGEFHERAGNPDAAERIYDRVLSASPAAVNVAQRLLQLLERQRRFGDAKAVLDRLAAGATVLGRHRALIALSEGNVSNAVDELQRQVEQNKQDVSARCLLARLLYVQKKDASAALQILDETEAAAAAERLSVALARVSILHAAGRTPEARQLMDAYVERDGSFEACAARAQFLAAVGELDIAEAEFKRLTTSANAADGFEQLGAFYAMRDRWDEAISAWEAGFKADAEHRLLPRRLAKALIRRGQPADFERAMQVLAELDKKYPDDVDVLWTRAIALLTQQRSDSTAEAQKLLERVVQIDPGVIDAHLGLVGIALRAGDHVKARERATRAQTLHAREPRILLAQAEVERAAGNLTMAHGLVREILKNDPRNEDARRLAAQLALAGDDKQAIAEALTATAEALARSPSDEHLQLTQARLLRAQDKTATAIEKLGVFAATEAGRQRPAVLLLLADLHMSLKEWAAAETRIDEAQKLAPATDPGVLQARSIWLAQQQRFDELASFASQHRTELLKAPALLLNVAGALGSSPSHLKEALAIIQPAADASPDSIDLRLHLGALLYQTGSVDRAEEIYRRVLDLQPSSVDALNNLAWILAESRRDYANALEMAEKAVRLAPINPHVLDTHGYILAKLPGRLADAKLAFERCATLAPPNSATRGRALLQLGRVCRELKESDRARQSLDEAIRIDKEQNIFTPQERDEINSLLAVLASAQ